VRVADSLLVAPPSALVHRHIQPITGWARRRLTRASDGLTVSHRFRGSVEHAQVRARLPAADGAPDRVHLPTRSGRSRMPHRCTCPTSDQQGNARSGPSHCARAALQVATPATARSVPSRTPDVRISRPTTSQESPGRGLAPQVSAAPYHRTPSCDGGARP
jgi:hypothetical protein